MKNCYFLSSFLIFFVGMLGSAQQNTKLDSLLSVYESQQDGIEKVKTLEALFFAANDENNQKGENYVREGLAISEKIDYSDGKARALHNLGYLYGLRRVPDSLSYYYQEAVSAYIELDDKKQLYKALYQWTRLENLEGNFEKALKLADSTINIASFLQNGEMLSDAYQRKSTVHLDKGEYKLAIADLISASKVLDTMEPPNPIKRGIIIVGIGRTELMRDNSKEAFPFFEEGLEIFKKEKHDLWQAITYMEIGSGYYQIKDYDGALENYENSLNISYKMKRDDFAAANLGNIGAVFIEQKKYDQALDYLFKSNEISVKRGSVNNQIITYNDIATAYLGKEDYPKAIENYSSAIKIADSIGSLDNLSDAYRERSQTYEKMGSYRLALSDHKQFQELKDSVFNTAKSRQIEELKTQYETEKKEQQILLQEQEIGLLEQQAKIGNLQRILLGGALALSLIGFYGIRQKFKRNKLEKEKVDAELAFKKKELTTHALHLAKKNEVLENIKLKARALQHEENSRGYKDLIKVINFDQQDDKSWENFTQYFEQVHKDFSKTVKAKYPDITKNELRLMALLKMNLSSKEIATILNISQDGIKKARYRLRKKLDLATEESLQDMVLGL